MTAWELQLAANAHGRSTATLSWLTAVFYRSKKLDPLEEIIEPYDSFKLKSEIGVRSNLDGIYQMMMRASKKSPSKGEGAGND